MNNDFNEYIFSKDVIEFVTVASEYCGFVEKIKQFKKVDFLEKSQKLLALLYLKTSILPKPFREEDGDIEKFVTEIDYMRIQESVAAKIGSHEQFISVLEPIRTEQSEAVQVSVSECFADIYQELRDFIENYQIGNEDIMQEALWECQLNFEIFWGPRLIATIGVIHNILYSGESLEDEEIENKESKKSKIKGNSLINKHLKQYRNEPDLDIFGDLFDDDSE